MRWEDFLPEYPPLEEEDFFRRIVKKKEFWSSSADVLMGEKIVLEPHQMNVARYMSQWTLYDSMLLYHEMGTGKSAVTISMVELFRMQNSEYQKVIYISHNQTQIDNYKREIFKFSTRLQAMLDMETMVIQDPILDAKRKESKRNSILGRDGFEFLTYGTVATELSRIMASKFMDRYEHCIIILDESHHLVLTDDQIEAKKSYAAIETFLNRLRYKKLLVMSGTPIRDQPHEIVPLLNLVLPKDKKFSNRSEFMHEYFEVMAEREVMPGIFLKIYEWKTGMRRIFREALRGRISYVRRETTSVEVDYVGTIYEPMTSLRLAVNVMNPADVQNEVYREEFEKEVRRAEAGAEEAETEAIVFRKIKKKKETSVYSKSKQASLFVFPNGAIGDEGYRTFVNQDYTMNKEFMKNFGDTTAEINALDLAVKLDLLSQFSTTYARLIGEIMAHPTELVYVFCDLVNGSGVLLLMSILKSLFQFSLVANRSQIRHDRTQARMILLNEEVTPEADFQDLIAYFNDAGNKEAAFCQVILSTSKTKEGISLKNVRQIHITTPTWNMGDMSQAMARSLRAKSHADLVDPKVRIFLHCAVPIDSEEEEETRREPTVMELKSSVDFQRYYRSEIKERNAKLIERVFLESSWDCAMNMSANSKTGRIVDGSRECEYSLCQYRCEGIDDEAMAMRGTDVANYNILYSNSAMDQILTAIRGVFQRNKIASLAMILEATSEISDANRILVEQCLVDIMTEPIMLLDEHRFPRFLMSRGNLFFLTDSPFLASSAASSFYYQQHPAVVVDFPIEEVMDGFYLQNLDMLTKQLNKMLYTRNSNAKAFFQGFPLVFQREFCELTLRNEILHPDRFMRFSYREWFIDNFRTEITQIANVLIDHHFVSEKKQLRRLDLSRPQDGWQTIIIETAP